MYHHREDYIVRLIASFTSVVATALRLRLKSEFKEAMTVLDTTGDQYRLSGMEHLSVDAMLDMLSTDSATGSLRGLLLATLLTEKAHIYAEQNETDNQQEMSAKAFQLAYQLLYVRDTSRIDEELSPEQLQEQDTKLRERADQLDYFAQPLDVCCDLMDYYEDIQQYDKAEDVLFTLLDRTNYDSEIAAIGISFYERLLDEDDATLIEGNLPRDEVEESLRELQSTTK